MKLVQVKAQGSHEGHEQPETRSDVVVTPYQLQLLGVQKVTAERMDLTGHIPISGRLISPSAVAFQVYESDLRYVKQGQTFRGASSFIPEIELIGTIGSIDSIIDPTTRTVRVVGRITKGPQGLLAETTFRGSIEVQLKGVIAIPESAVIHAGSVDLIYLVNEDGSLSAHPVKLGRKSESYYEVVDGLAAGQEISSGPNFLMDSEAKIRGTSGHAHH